ncbi:MAG: arsenate reductase family protein [Verrucomicrobiales bacterium]|nr:arsenate reductase family protein [Verrucomicrobiales bacterium]
MIKIYAYSGCSTCRNALKFLKDRRVAHEVVAIRETPPSKAELKRMLDLCEGQVRRLFNTSGQDYRALGLGAKLDSMSLDEALTLLSGNGNLVKRPFALSKDRGVVGFKVEEWERLVG